MRELPAALLARFQTAAAGLTGRDDAVYHAAGRDPTMPIFGLGPADAPLMFFGRDPGRDEVHVGVPFIGAGGRQVRRVLCDRRPGQAPMDTAEAIAAGERYFWANTVPYKPLGNKAWPMRVKRGFRPLVAEVLLDLWQGRDVITLGREAFFWFALGQSPAVGHQLDEHWRRGDRFERSLPVDYVGPDGRQRTLNLHPLPHPSPLNATWYKRFPGLLAERLDQLEGIQ
jgi:uracil-DNA glycosylase